MDVAKIGCPAFCGMVGIILSILFGFWCESFEYPGQTIELDSGLPDPSNPLNRTKSFTFQARDFSVSPWYQKEIDVEGGVYDVGTNTFTVYFSNTCEEWYTTDGYDSKFTFVRAATVIGPTLGGLLTILVCLTPCLGEAVNKLWHCTGCCFILVVTLFQGLTFLFLKSDACQTPPNMKYINEFVNDLADEFDSENLPELGNITGLFKECELESGSYLNIAAIICWFFAGAIMLGMGAPGGDGEGSDSTPAQKEEEAAPEGDGGDSAPAQKEEQASEQPADSEEGDKDKSGDASGDTPQERAENAEEANA